MKKQNYIIIDIATEKSLRGAGKKTMRFSTKEIAREVAIQIFASEEKFIIVDIIEDLGLSFK